MTKHHQSLTDAERADLRHRVEAALASFDVDDLIVDVARDGSIGLRGIVADRDARRAVLAAATSAAGRPVGDALGSEPFIDYPPEGLDPQSGQPAGAFTAAAGGVEIGDRDGAEIDFNDDNVGVAGPMRSTSEAEPWTPPIDPVERPANKDEGIEIVGGFATTSLDGSADTGDEPARTQMGDSELEEGVRALLERDAATAGLEINVKVRSGVVVLSGTVQSLDDVESAEEVASRVPGIVEVREHLSVESFDGA